MKNRKFIYIISILVVSITCFSQCDTMLADSHDPRGKEYAGSVTCRSCHQAIYDSVLRSGHYNASAPAIEQTVLGNFNQGHNKFVFEMGTTVKMEKRDSGLYQVMYVDGKEKIAHRFRFDFWSEERANLFILE